MPMKFQVIKHKSSQFKKKSVKVDIWLAKIIAHQRCVTEQFKQVRRVGFYPPTMTD